MMIQSVLFDDISFTRAALSLNFTPDLDRLICLAAKPLAKLAGSHAAIPRAH